MSLRAQSREEREVAATARRYRRDGYKVRRLRAFSERPSFLGDLVPDLIAERDDDKVVIEIKQADKVAGSNDIVEIAELVAAQPGWRFELIGLSTPSPIAMPNLSQGFDEVQRLLDQGFLRPAFIILCAIIENLAAYAAVERKQKPEAQPLRTLVRDLVVHGVIDDVEKRAIDEALDRRNAILHGSMMSLPTSDEIQSLIAIAGVIQRELEAGDDVEVGKTFKR